MGIFILPITETNSGWVEIEADTIEEARDIAENGNPFETADPQWRSGEIYYESNDIVEATPDCNSGDDK
jgi:hypothetical protein